MEDVVTSSRRPVSLDDVVTLLARTPRVVDAWLRDLPVDWVTANEGVQTWSPFDVVGHLIHAERTDWIPRVRRILEDGDTVAFEPFDRLAQFREHAGKPLSTLLDEFAELRRASLDTLRSLEITGSTLSRPGLHPALGRVTLGQLLATWVAHDLDHIMQIARVLATQYADEVGPWRAYLRIISGQRT